MVFMKAIIVATWALAVLSQGDSFFVRDAVDDSENCNYTSNSKWDDWKRCYNKTYNSTDDDDTAERNFNYTDCFVNSENAKNRTYKLGHNKFSALSLKGKQALLGVKPKSAASGVNYRAADRQRRPSATTATQAISKAVPAGSLDYRTSPCLQPVKDQGNCGSCWAFSVIALVEFGHCNLTGSAVALSEQQLVDCDTNDYGCNGGNQDVALKYLATAGGSDTSASYPYTSGTSGTEEACKNSSATIGAKVSTTTPVTSYANNIAGMKAALTNNKLVSVTIAVVNSFMQYSSGIYAEPKCKRKVLGYHAITVVGYGTDAATGTSYWIVRNSWGTRWGQAGYIYFKMGANICQIESLGVYSTTVVG